MKDMNTYVAIGTYVCLYVCMSVCLSVCMSVCMHACMYGKYVCACEYMYMHILLREYLHVKRDMSGHESKRHKCPTTTNAALCNDTSAQTAQVDKREAQVDKRLNRQERSTSRHDRSTSSKETREKHTYTREKRQETSAGTRIELT